MTVEEKALISWYRCLSQLNQLAIRYWLITGDAHFVIWLRIFSSYPHQIAQIAAAKGRQQLAFSSRQIFFL